jgi:cytoskeletal protein RodZ
MKLALGPTQNGSSQQSLTLNLAKKRGEKNISIDDIANSTRISPLYLRAIEAEDFSQLPGGIYAVSYIRQYSAAAGCDENDVLARYRSIVEPQDGPENREPSSRAGGTLRTHFFQ